MAKNKNSKPKTIVIKNNSTQKTYLKNLISFKDIKLTQSQHELCDKINNNEIIFAYGPAGSSKTFTTLFSCLKLISQEKYDKLLISKPLEESGDKLGFLKGSIEMKVSPYSQSFYDNIGKIVSYESAQLFSEDNSEYVSFKPLSFMRGSSFDNTIMLLDEAQNADFRQLILFISRIGSGTKGSKAILLSDVSQYDIKKDRVAITKFMEMIKDIKGVVIHEFKRSDIVRNKMLIEITDRYEKWLDEGKITLPKN